MAISLKIDPRTTPILPSLGLQFVHLRPYYTPLSKAFIGLTAASYKPLEYTVIIAQSERPRDIYRIFMFFHLQFLVSRRPIPLVET